jgi:hypothetical protein
MSRTYNPAISAYKRMSLEDFNKLEGSVPQEKSNGLLARSANYSKASGIDYSNPAVRIAKQMQVIRKYRDDINGTK